MDKIILAIESSCDETSIAILKNDTELLANIISYHHNPSLSSIPVPCNLVCAVDALMQESFNPNKLDKDFLKTMGIDLDDLEDLRNAIKSKAELLISELT